MKYIVLILFSIFVFGCADNDNSDEETSVPRASAKNTASVGYSYHSEDGNRYVTGSTDITSLTPIDIPLSDKAEWISVVKQNNASIWAVAMTNGKVAAFKVSNNQYEAIPITPTTILQAAPLTLVLSQDGSAGIANIVDDGSPYTSPVIVDSNTGARAYIAKNNDLVLLSDDGEEQRLAINALNYSRILRDDNNRLLLLTGPTLRYNHQVLGDSHPNASAITLVETSPEFKVFDSIVIDAPDVIEGNPLIWKDIDNDGEREIITTLSNITDGARIVIYKEDGTIYSESAAIDISYRWRHQIAVAPFIQQNELTLASVYIPHLAPELEVFALNNNMDVIRKGVNYTSHRVISLNLDKSIAGDFDDDDVPEILLFNRDTEKEIAAYSMSNNDIKLDWTLSLTEIFTSNIAAVTLDNNQIALGVGQGKTLRIWHP